MYSYLLTYLLTMDDLDVLCAQHARDLFAIAKFLTSCRNW